MSEISSDIRHRSVAFICIRRPSFRDISYDTRVTGIRSVQVNGRMSILRYLCHLFETLTLASCFFSFRGRRMDPKRACIVSLRLRFRKLLFVVCTCILFRLSYGFVLKFATDSLQVVTEQPTQNVSRPIWFWSAPFNRSVVYMDGCRVISSDMFYDILVKRKNIEKNNKKHISPCRQENNNSDPGACRHVFEK